MERKLHAEDIAPEEEDDDPEEGKPFVISQDDFYDLLMEQQEQM